MRLNLSRSELARSHDFTYNLWVETTNKGLEGGEDNTEGGEGEDIKSGDTSGGVDNCCGLGMWVWTPCLCAYRGVRMFIRV